MTARPGKTSTDGMSDAVATIRIELLGTDPAIWREVEVPVACTLEDLHDVVQAAMEWDSYHLWEFTIGKVRYGLPMEDGFGLTPCLPAEATHLADVMRPRRTRIDYLYDFGDDWEPRLTVEKARPPDPDAAYPRYVAGAMNAPPEDCGGVWGFYDKLDVLKSPDDPDHVELSDWFGGYDPKAIDEAGIRAALAKLVKRSPKRSRAARKKPA